MLGLWLWAIHGLMVTDVWDETNALLLLKTPPFSISSTADTLIYVWTHYLGLYRPLAESLVVVLQKWGSEFQQLRYFNAAIVFAAVTMFAKALHKHFATPLLWVAIFVALTLTSSGVVITIGWFTNIFDATCLFLIALGFLLILGDHRVLGGSAIGLAFFCKETAVLAIPFLFVLNTSGKLSLKSVFKILIPVILIAASYAVLRQRVVTVGASNDIHTFTKDIFWPSEKVFLKSFWWQHTKFSETSIHSYFGLGFLLMSIGAIRDYRNKLIALTILFIASVAYWGMFSYQGEVVISSLNFVGRLYLIPATLLLFLLAIDGRRFALLILAVPLISGATSTYVDHLRFQQLYQEIYNLTEKHNGTLTVHYSEKPLDDQIRRVRIGDYPNAAFKVDREKAKLIAHQ